MIGLRDEASGLFSWDAFVAIAQMLIALTQRRGGDLSLLLVSVDEPHRISADTAVRILTQQSIRASDTVGRYGPYSIAMLAPDAPRAGALRLVERILASMSGQLDTFGGPASLQVSIGIASLFEGDKDLDDLLQRAQAALAEAVANGGNQARYAGTVSEPDNSEENGSEEAPVRG